MPSVIGHPVFRELLHEESVKTARETTSSSKKTFFTDNVFIGFRFANLKQEI
jgi:hypothetical protein